MEWNDRLYFCQVDMFLKSGVKWTAVGFFWLDLFFLILVLDNLVSVSHEITADELVYFSR